MLQPALKPVIDEFPSTPAVEILVHDALIVILIAEGSTDSRIFTAYSTAVLASAENPE